MARPMSRLGLLEEASMTAQISVERDAWELAALETLWTLLAEERPNIPACRKLVGTILRHDLRENQGHRETLDLIREAIA